MMWPLKTSPQTAATSSISCSSLLASPLTYAAATSALPDSAAPSIPSSSMARTITTLSSASPSAELGHAGGAVINVVTKSGTNNFHGAAFEFFRDRSLNANDPINIINGRQKSPYHFNQFGGDVGGPVLREKLFFFFDYDGP